MASFKTLIAASLISAPLAGYGLDQNCPLEIKTSQTIQTCPAGFEMSQSPAPHFLVRVTFYAGHPKEQASLSPDITRKDKMHWTFSKQDKIYVSYGYNNTNIELIKRLPINITSCTVYYDATAMGQFGGLPKKIVCY